MRSNTKEKISLIYKIIIILVSCIGLCLNIKASPGKEMFLYFTILSNIACLLFYIITVPLQLTKKLKKNNIYHIFKGMVTMAITLTFIVFQVFISADNAFYETHIIENLFVHLFVPTMVMLDYVIFDEKGNIKKSYPIIWSSMVVVYTLLCEVYIALGGTFLNGSEYPYFFMDTSKYGIIKVIFIYLVMYVAYVVYGYLVYYLDNKVKKMTNKYK